MGVVYESMPLMGLLYLPWNLNHVMWLSLFAGHCSFIKDKFVLLKCHAHICFIKTC